MKSTLVKHRAAAPELTGLRRVLPQVQELIERSRQQVATTANLALVNLYWNIGRVTQLPSKSMLADRLKIYGRMLVDEDRAS